MNEVYRSDLAIPREWIGIKLQSNISKKIDWINKKKKSEEVVVGWS